MIGRQFQCFTRLQGGGKRLEGPKELLDGRFRVSEFESSNEIVENALSFFLSPCSDEEEPVEKSVG